MSSGATTGTAVANTKGGLQEHEASSHAFPTGEIVGLSVGIFLVLLLLVATSMYICGRQSKHKREPHRQKTLERLPGESPPIGGAAAERKWQYSPYQGQLLYQYTTKYKMHDQTLMIIVDTFQSPEPSHHFNSSRNSPAALSDPRFTSFAKLDQNSRGGYRQMEGDARNLAPLELDGLTTAVAELDSHEIVTSPVVEDEIQSPRARRSSRKKSQAKGSGYIPINTTER
jgi:hypothetical protein